MAWLYICWLHWDNDGLWYGDAPHHAANGLFWKDYLLSLSLHPKDYALSYHARYPVIAPTTYPPVFYVVEAVVFGVFGSSPYIAKGLVLGFALMAGLYTTAWCRRWVSKDAAWAGMVLVLLPGVVRWSSCIMLNVPAVALSIGALYHTRRWLESPKASPAWRHLYVGAVLAVLSILTYLTSCVVAVIAGIWLVVERRWDLLWKRKTVLVLVLSALALVPWVLVVLKFERSRSVWATGTADHVSHLLNWPWMYYLRRFPELFGAHLLLIAAVGIAAGLAVRRWRHETLLMLLLTLICYGYSYLPAKEGRYILLLSLPLVIFCLFGLLTIATYLGKLLGIRPNWAKATTLLMVVSLFIGQAWLTSRVYVMSISGYKELVKYIEKIAPDESVFYDGKNSGIFTFYIQSRDPGYCRRVVLGQKLLYAEGITSSRHEFVSSAEEVVERLQKRGGCQWLAIADSPDSPPSEAAWSLRGAIKGPQFKLVKSFPITRTKTNGLEKTDVNLYQFLLPVQQADEVDMPYFSLGEGVRFKVKPIQR
jgi:hypothetical protein